MLSILHRSWRTQHSISLMEHLSCQLWSQQWITLTRSLRMQCYLAARIIQLFAWPSRSPNAHWISIDFSEVYRISIGRFQVILSLIFYYLVVYFCEYSTLITNLHILKLPDGINTGSTLQNLSFKSNLSHDMPCYQHQRMWMCRLTPQRPPPRRPNHQCIHYHVYVLILIQTLLGWNSEHIWQPPISCSHPY